MNLTDPPAVRDRVRLAAAPATAVETVRVALEHRLAGRSVVFAPELPDLRDAGLALVSALLLQNDADWDARAAIFAQLAAGGLRFNDKGLDELVAFAPETLLAMRDLALLADAVTVRSGRERERVRAFLGEIPRPFEIAIAPHTPIRAPRDGAREIVVYAPDRTTASLGSLLIALREVRVPNRWIVADDPTPYGVRVANESALEAAALVIVPHATDPSVAVALAQTGHRVVAPASSGIDDWIPAARTYAVDNVATIVAAVVDTLGAPRPRVRDASVTLAPLERSSQTPLVTIVVPTHRRPRSLRRTLASLAAQTYPRIEVVVVNDAGLDVADVVAEFAGATLITHEQNAGLPATRNTGIRHGHGDYFLFIDDDDVYFPDHVERLVAAAERSGAAIAYCDFALGFARAAGDGVEIFAAKVESTLMQPSGMLVANLVGNLTMLLRADVLAADRFDESLTVCEDYDLWVRLSQQHAFVHVPHVGALYTVRHDGENMTGERSNQFLGAYERIYAKNPLVARPRLVAQRDAVLAQHRAGNAHHALALDRPAFPPIRVL